MAFHQPHKHQHTHTHTDAETQAGTHAHTHTHARTHTHTRTHARTHMHTHAHMHTHTLDTTLVSSKLQWTVQNCNDVFKTWLHCSQLHWLSQNFTVPVISSKPQPPPPPPDLFKSSSNHRFFIFRILLSSSKPHWFPQNFDDSLKSSLIPKPLWIPENPTGFFITSPVSSKPHWLLQNLITSLISSKPQWFLQNMELYSSLFTDKWFVELNTPFRRLSCQAREEKGSSRQSKQPTASPSKKSHVSYWAARTRRREKMAAEGTSSTTRQSLLQSVLVCAVDSCHCPHPSHPSPALLPNVSLSLSLTRFGAFNDVIVLNVHNMLPILGKQPPHLGYRPVLCGFSLWLVGFPVFRLGDWFT